MDFRPMSMDERTALLAALRGNHDSGSAILMDRSTRFAAAAPIEADATLPITDEEVIFAVQSVPCHY